MIKAPKKQSTDFKDQQIEHLQNKVREQKNKIKELEKVIAGEDICVSGSYCSYCGHGINDGWGNAYCDKEIPCKMFDRK